MTKKPKKKPFRITGPGLYRTRDGRRAFVSHIEEGMAYPALGVIEGCKGMTEWTLSGAWASGTSEYDLISRWPGKKAKKGKRNARK